MLQRTWPEAVWKCTHASFTGEMSASHSPWTLPGPGRGAMPPAGESGVGEWTKAPLTVGRLQVLVVGCPAQYWTNQKLVLHSFS
jgi:hypothetical protein